MHFSDPISDYIKKSILTAKGAIVQQGDSDPQQLPLGDDKQILTVNSMSGLTRWEDLPPIPEFGYDNGYVLTSNETINTIWNDVIHFDGIDVLEGEVYRFSYSPYLITAGACYVKQRLVNSGSNTAEVTVNNVSHDHTFEDEYNESKYSSGALVLNYFWDVQIGIGGTLDLIVSTRLSAGSGTIYGGFTTAWINKLK